MSIEDFLSRTRRRATIVRVVAGDEDEYGDATDGSAGRDTYDAWLAHTESIELRIGRDTVITNWILVLPAGAGVNPRDRIEMDDGSLFEVIGQPVRAERPGGEDHVECHVREILG